MAEPTFSNIAETSPFDDDLPRTLRRERESQARRAASTSNAANDDQSAPVLALNSPSEPVANIPSMGRRPIRDDTTDHARSTVTRLEIPFLHLMAFFLKAVIAAIPALILLLALLWLAGEALTATFPDLVKVQVLIRMPN
jgi:hypothetical protein